MYILDKKDDSIDVYTMKAQNEELKRYRKTMIEKYKDEIHFYQIMTNSSKTIEYIMNNNLLDIKLLNYKEENKWSVFNLMDNYSMYMLTKQDEILKKYMDGYYDCLLPTKVYHFIWDKDLDYYLLKTEPEKVLHGYGVLGIDNLLSIPRNLYLLQLLQTGEFNNLTDENITGLLNLFDINFDRNIKLSNINDKVLKELRSKNIDEVITKANAGTQILKRVR